MLLMDFRYFTFSVKCDSLFVGKLLLVQHTQSEGELELERVDYFPLNSLSIDRRLKCP